MKMLLVSAQHASQRCREVVPHIQRLRDVGARAEGYFDLDMRSFLRYGCAFLATLLAFLGDAAGLGFLLGENFSLAVILFSSAPASPCLNNRNLIHV
jgi:hypothetical protein